MLEEMIDDESFFRKCDEYFSELGHACIFTMYEGDINPPMIRLTIDTIYSQLYIMQSRIGSYLSKYSDTG